MNMAYIATPRESKLNCSSAYEHNESFIHVKNIWNVERCGSYLLNILELCLFTYHRKVLKYLNCWYRTCIVFLGHVHVYC